MNDDQFDFYYLLCDTRSLKKQHDAKSMKQIAEIVFSIGLLHYS